MKEQVSAGDYMQEIMHPDDENRLAVVLDKEQYNRLKRLDENVKDMIVTLKEQSDSLNHTRSSIYARENKYIYAAEILESLDK